MAEEILAELANKVVNDKGFRERILNDLEGTLAKSGYLKKLTDEELSAIREFNIQSRGLNPEELNRRLADVTQSRIQGI